MNEEPSDTENGRTAQKLRTRRRLLRAASDMMARQETITIGAVAAEAGVSVATAYRYFNDPETIRLEAVIELNLSQSGDFMKDMHAQCEGVTSVTKRVIVAQRLMAAFVGANEDAYRLFLAKGHEQVVAHRGKRKVPPRGGRRLPMIEFALEPWRMDLTGRAFRDAVLRVAVACGTEAYFVLADLCDLEREEADTVIEDVLRRLIRSLAEEHGMPAD